jgi:hypothetical protein
MLRVIAAVGLLGVALKSAPKINLQMTATGIENAPDSPGHRRNLAWVSGQIPRVLAELRPIASYQVTSVYRNAAVNRAVGGSQSSRHLQGLAVDLGGLRGPKAGRDAVMLESARRLRSRGFHWVRVVLAELDRNHLHIEFSTPWEPAAGDVRYAVLAGGRWGRLT